MTDKERSKLSMYESLISFINENREITINVRGFSQTGFKLRKIVDDIKLKEKELSSDILGKTIITYKAKDELVFSLVPVTIALFNFAKSTGNLSLKEKTRYGQSHFYRMMDRELIYKAELMCILTGSCFPKIKKFGINSNTLRDLTNKINNYKACLDNKITSLISSNMVASLGVLFDSADKICNMMDSFAEILSENFTEFYDDYIEVRTLEYHSQKNELLEEEVEEEEYES